MREGEQIENKFVQRRCCTATAAKVPYMLLAWSAKANNINISYEDGHRKEDIFLPSSNIFYDS